MPLAFLKAASPDLTGRLTAAGSSQAPTFFVRYVREREGEGKREEKEGNERPPDIRFPKYILRTRLATSYRKIVYKLR